MYPGRAEISAAESAPRSIAAWQRTGAMPIKVLHVINSLGIAGAELALFRLINHSDHARFHMSVVALLYEAPLGEQLKQAGVSVDCLDLKKGSWNVDAVPRLTRLLRRDRPDIVQTWLQQSDLTGGIAARLAGISHVFWNIRHSTLHPVFTPRHTQIVTKLCAKMARFVPERVVCCSEASRREQIQLGYPAERMHVIPNGVDMSRFKPDGAARQQFRQELGIGDDFLFGAAGRLHAQKDYPNLITAAGEIARSRPRSHFVFCGEGVTDENPELRERINATGFPERFHLLGQQRNMPRFMAALDVFVSGARFGEGFPNVVSEAMACAVPCVVTDVGDSAVVVGDTGIVVPPEQPARLRDAALTLAELDPDHLHRLGLSALDRVRERFSLRRMVESYQQLYAATVRAGA